MAFFLLSFLLYVIVYVFTSFFILRFNSLCQGIYLYITVFIKLSIFCRINKNTYSKRTTNRVQISFVMFLFCLIYLKCNLGQVGHGFEQQQQQKTNLNTYRHRQLDRKNKKPHTYISKMKEKKLRTRQVKTRKNII